MVAAQEVGLPSEVVTPSPLVGDPRAVLMMPSTLQILPHLLVLIGEGMDGVAPLFCERKTINNIHAAICCRLAGTRRTQQRMMGMAILVIEDREPVCRLYGSLLQYANYHPVLAYTGEDGIQAALVNRPDLVILDMMLPGISGAEVAQKLQESGILPGIPLIIATAMRFDEAEAVFQPFRPAAILIKPFDVDSLLAAVHAGLTDDCQKAPCS